MSKQIPLYKHGKIINYAVVDDEDYEDINKYQWHLLDTTKTKGNHTVYAVRYSRRSGKRETVLMHREILLRYNNEIDTTDHINHNGLDNRRLNLRNCTPRENSLNQRSFIGYKGIYYDKSRGKWQAKIWDNRKGIGLGRFDTIEEAIYVYNKKAIELYGDFAYLNALSLSKAQIQQFEQNEKYRNDNPRFKKVKNNGELCA